jgi:hypothetical protein
MIQEKRLQKLSAANVLPSTGGQGTQSQAKPPSSISSWSIASSPRVGRSGQPEETVSSPVDLSIGDWQRDVAEATTGALCSNSDCTSLHAATSAAYEDRYDDSDSGQSQTQDEADATGSANSNSELEPEPYSDDGHIEYDLTIEVPSEAIEDDRALALVQVIPPDTDLSGIPETWDVYNIDLSGDPPDEEREIWEQSESDRCWEEDPPNNIYDEPDGGSYYSEDPDEDQESNKEPVSGSYYPDESDADSYYPDEPDVDSYDPNDSDDPDEGHYSDDPDEGYSDPELDADASGEG